MLTESKSEKRTACLILSFSLFALSCHWASADDTRPPSDASVHYQQGLAYERLGRYDEAYTELQVAANLLPDSAEMALAVGVIATRLGRYDEGLRSLEHSLALNADSVASYYELALLYERKHLSDRALESWKRFLALNQDVPLKDVAQKHIAYLEGQR